MALNCCRHEAWGLNASTAVRISCGETVDECLKSESAQSISEIIPDGYVADFIADSPVLATTEVVDAVQVFSRRLGILTQADPSFIQIRVGPSDSPATDRCVQPLGPPVRKLYEFRQFRTPWISDQVFDPAKVAIVFSTSQAPSARLSS